MYVPHAKAFFLSFLFHSVIAVYSNLKAALLHCFSSIWLEIFRV